MERFLDWLTGLPPVLVYVILAALSAIENIFPPVPADVAVVLGAFLGHRGVTSPWLLGFVCWVANVVSAAWMYDIARRRGPAFFASGWPAALMPPAAQDAIRDAYACYGVWGIFFTRFLPAVRSAVTPFAGVAGMPPLRVLPPAAAASALWYAFLVAAGTLVGNNWERAERLVTNANRALGLVALAFTVAFGVWLWRRVRARRSA
jgi:membrane protein DedA with SNARE-associated domain